MRKNYKAVKLLSIQQLIGKAKIQILDLFTDYHITQESLFSDIKKIILHCTIGKLIDELDKDKVLILVDLKWKCDPDLAEIIGENKCQKALIYLANNLRKIFKDKFQELLTMPDENNLPGEIIELTLKCKSFNFKKLNMFLAKNSLSGLKSQIHENLSVKQKIFNNF